MTNRKILYGYQIQNGELTTVPAEAVVVSRVFTLYDSGLSYQKISDALNTDGIPFSEDAVWNKHKVKRLLGNPRYTGENGYPCLVDSTVFQRIQAEIQEKATDHATQEKSPAAYLAKLLRCESCGGPLKRFGRRGCQKGILYLKCEGCGAVVNLPEDALLDELLSQKVEHDSTRPEPYTPSKEVVRLDNAINRGLERPIKPEDVVSFILQGVSARYDCCPTAPTLYGNDDRPAEADWKRFGQAVSHIMISTENTVTAYFQS